MLGFIIRRLLWTLPVLLVATLLTFGLVKALPYEPFVDNPKLTDSQVQSLQALYGLDEPWPVQYVSFLRDLVTLDLGYSTKPGALPIAEIVAEKLPVSMLLGLLAFCVAAALGLLLGVVSALRANGITDYAITLGSTLAFALPTFVTAALWVKYVPWYGWDSWLMRIGPVTVLAVSIMPYFVRLVRASMLEALQQEYIVTARAKGMPWRTTVTRHALRNSLIPTVVNAGPLFGFVLTGSFLIERIMVVPDIADEFVRAFGQPLDSQLILVTTVLVSAVIVMMNLLVDILVALIDPRIAHD